MQTGFCMGPIYTAHSQEWLCYQDRFQAGADFHEIVIPSAADSAQNDGLSDTKY
jgi:hypothetical protein